MIRVLGTAFFALLGLAFGSFLNVCATRWPEGESMVRPGSHCRSCGRTLNWYENVPLASWIVLRGRCRTCGAWIGWRYLLVEATMGGLWGVIGFRHFSHLLEPGANLAVQPATPPYGLLGALGLLAFCWLLVWLAVLDAEHFWVADGITIPGMFLGLAYSLFCTEQAGVSMHAEFWKALGMRVLAVLVSAGLILLIRWSYWLFRHREGIGLGDAKLMAMIAAWLGLPHAMLAFVLGVLLGTVLALALLFVPAERRGSESWAHARLPLGTFLCMGGIVSALWGGRMIAAYLRYSGF